MKAASTATINILKGGMYLLADLYQMTLATGNVVYLTAFQTPLNVAIYPSGTSNLYQAGYTIIRGSMTQACGVDSQDMQLKIAPRFDNPQGAPTVDGYPIQQAARLGLLDNASVLYAKFFGAIPVPPATLDTSPGAVAYFQGAVADIQSDRLVLTLKISSNLLVLSQVQMPKNLFQASCSHTLFDPGCGAHKATYTTSASITSIPTGSGIVPNSNFTSSTLTQAAGYFNLGVITFTSGNNNGFSATVKLFASGNIQTMIPFPGTLQVGDNFTIVPGCDKLQSTCSSKFGNLVHFNGKPYVPVTETLYDGGTSNPPNPSAPGQQKGSTIGSTIGGQLIQVTRG